MATTQTVQGIDQVKGESGPKGELRVMQVPVRVKGGYLTGTKPTFDILASLKANGHFAATAIAVKSVVALRDAWDGTNRYTASNANIALSGTGNTTVTFRIDSGATNGDGSGAEIADATVLDGVFVFLVVAQVTAN